jgi:hypothetical protein
LLETHLGAQFVYEKGEAQGERWKVQGKRQKGEKFLKPGGMASLPPELPADLKNA